MYYVLGCFDPPSGYLARIEFRESDPFRSWIRGELFKREPKTPLKARVVSDPQTVLAELWYSPLPLMTTRLYEALQTLGVDNLHPYSVELRDSQTDAEISGYIAFNLVAVFAATDLEKTQFAEEKVRMTSADIDYLVIDPERVGPSKMFRLAESVGTILVHQSVKEGLQDMGFETLTFTTPSEWVT